MINLNNNVYNNKMGDETFLSRIQKYNKEAVKQDSLINNDEELNIHESEITTKIREEEIAKKIAKGEQVTLKELKYIKKYNPLLLKKAKSIKIHKEKTECKVRNANSEEEVENIIESANLKALTSLATGKMIDGAMLENEAVKQIKREVGYKRIDRLV